MRLTALSLVLSLHACGDAERETATPTPAPILLVAPTSTPAAAPTREVPIISAPRPRYDDREGKLYHYVAAISEKEQEEGKSAPDVVSFAYGGRVDGAHVLASVSGSGSMLNWARCREPCKIIEYRDGRRVAYRETSIIGSAFADAIDGFLRADPNYLPPELRPRIQQPPEIFPDPTAGTNLEQPREESLSVLNPAVEDSSFEVNNGQHTPLP